MTEILQHGISIFWDGYGLDQVHSGICSYAKSVSDEMIKQEVRPKIIGLKEVAQNFPNLQLMELPSSKKIPILGNSKLFWSNRVDAYLNHLIKIYNSTTTPIIIHGLSNINIPTKKARYSNVKRVITIHDIIPLLVPEMVSHAYYQQFKYLLPKVIKAADLIITISEWTKNTLIERYPKAKEKIVVIPNGFVHMDFEQVSKQRPSTTGAKAKLLSVGRYEPYKNLDILIEVLRKKSYDYQLTLVTNLKGKEWANREASDLIAIGALKVLTHIESNALSKLYHETDVLVHPSFYEGYCLPAAEALASGTPVVYLSGSAIDETVGNVVGIPLPVTASVFDWIDAISYAAHLKHTEQFKVDVQYYVENAPKWSGTAQKIIHHYKNIFEA